MSRLHKVWHTDSVGEYSAWDASFHGQCIQLRAISVSVIFSYVITIITICFIIDNLSQALSSFIIDNIMPCVSFLTENIQQMDNTEKDIFSEANVIFNSTSHCTFCAVYKSCLTGYNMSALFIFFYMYKYIMYLIGQPESSQKPKVN